MLYYDRLTYTLCTWHLNPLCCAALGTPKKATCDSTNFDARYLSTGTPSSLLGVLLYLLLNWAYTTAVFTPPGSTTNDSGYSTLPTNEHRSATTLTVKANGEIRFCKKCQARKPDRAHHCSTCRRCVLKMDHHCPWLATCIGLRNHKAFLLFLIYTSLFSLFCFAVGGLWLWDEIVSDTTYIETLMPVQYVVLTVIAGIIALVVGAFTAWHIMLAAKGQTTIECLEKTRYLSPLRRTMQRAYTAQHTDGQGVALPRYGQQLLDMHQDILPGVTRPEEGEELRTLTPASQWNGEGGSGTLLNGMPRHRSYDEMERHRARKRYEEYLDEQDSSKMPNAFDLGWRRNLLHMFGHNPWLWAFPICNTTGDGWVWEPSPKWLEARERIERERNEQRARERAAGWGIPEDDNLNGGSSGPSPSVAAWNPPLGGAGRHYAGERPDAAHRRTQSKADRVLGRDPNLYTDGPLSGGVAVSSRPQLSPADATKGSSSFKKNRPARPGDIYGDNDSLFDTSSDELEEEEQEEQQKAGQNRRPSAVPSHSSSPTSPTHHPFGSGGGPGGPGRLGGVSGLLRKASNNSLAAAANTTTNRKDRNASTGEDEDGVD